MVPKEKRGEKNEKEQQKTDFSSLFNNQTCEKKTTTKKREGATLTGRWGWFSKRRLIPSPQSPEGRVPSFRSISRDSENIALLLGPPHQSSQETLLPVPGFLWREGRVAHDAPRRGWSPGHARPPEPIPRGLPETHPLRLPRYLPAAWWQAGPPLGRSSAAAAGGPRTLRHSSQPRSGPVGRPLLPHPPPPIPRLRWASGGPRARGLSLVLISPAVPRTCGPSTGAIRPSHSRSGRAWEGARFLHTTHILQEGDQPAAAPAHIPSKWSSPNQEGKTERWLAKTNEHAKQARRSPRPPEVRSPPHGQGLPPTQSDPAECPRASAARPGAASAGGLKDYVAIYLPLREKTLSALRLSATGN